MSDNNFIKGLEDSFKFMEGTNTKDLYEKGTREEIDAFERFLSTEGICADPELYKTLESCIDMVNHSLNNIRYVPIEIQDSEEFHEAFYAKLETDFTNEIQKTNSLLLAYDDEASAKRKIINAITHHIKSDALELYILMNF